MSKDPNGMYELLKKWAADPNQLNHDEVEKMNSDLAREAREDRIRIMKHFETEEEKRLRMLEKKYNIRILRKHERIDDSAWEGVR